MSINTLLCGAGRTGRAGAKGVAYSFFTAANARLAAQIIAVLKEADQPVPAQLVQFAEVSGGAMATGAGRAHPLTSCSRGDSSGQLFTPFSLSHRSLRSFARESC